jgi:hypothetical protein
VPAEIDFDRRREPPEIPMSLPPPEERRLGEVHLPGDVLHPYAFAIFGEEADSGRIAGERAIREGVDVKEGGAHDPLLAHTAAASKSHLFQNGLGYGTVIPRSAATEKLPSVGEPGLDPSLRSG